MQTAHTTAPPAAPFPLITMCCGRLASRGGCLLRKQARADATGGISKSQAFRLWGQRDSSIGNTSKTDQRPGVSLTIQAATKAPLLWGLGSCPPFSPLLRFQFWLTGSEHSFLSDLPWAEPQHRFLHRPFPLSGASHTCSSPCCQCRPH